MTNRVVKVVLRGDVGDLVGKLKATSSAVKSTGESMTAADREAVKFRQGMTTVGTAATRMGLVAAGGVALITKAAMDWESAWTGVLKTVDGTPEQLARLEDGLRSLAKETGTAHAEVAAVAEAAGQLGISTSGIEDFTRTVLAMAVSTSLSSEEAATGLARLRNIMGTTEAEIANTGSAMVELGNNFATTESEILAMSLRTAGAGRQAGLTTADVLGLSAAMSSVGIEAEAGGTAVSLTLKRIGKEVETNGSKLELFARTAGMSVEEFRRAWGDDAAGTFTKFIAGLDKAKESGTSTNAVLRELGVTGIRESDALLRLSGNAEGLAAALAASSDEFDRNAALTQEAGKFYDTTAAKSRQAWAGIKDNAIDAGQAILPVLAQMADGVSAVTGAFGALPGPVKSSVGVFAGLSATALLSVGAFVKVTNTIASARVALDQLAISAPRSAGAIGKLGKAAGVATAAMAALHLAGRFQDSDVASVEKFTAALLDLSDGTAESLEALAGSNMGLLDEGLGGIAAALYEVKSNSKGLSKVGSDIAGVLSIGQFQDEKSTNSLKALDQALTSLTISGAPEKAAEGFAYIAERAAAVGVPLDELTTLFPEYAAALDDADNQQRLAADGTGDLAGGIDEVGGAADDAASQVQALNDSLNGLLDPYLAQEDASNAWKDSLASLTAELKETGASLDDNTEKGRASQDAIRDRVKALKDSAQADLEAGASQEEFSGKLIRGAEHIINAARAAGVGEDAVRDYIATLGLTPEQVETLLEVDDRATPTIDRVGYSIRALDGQRATVRVDVKQAYTTSGQRVTGGYGGGLAEADGGVVDYYANGGLRENHVAQIAPAGAWRVWAEPETGGEAYIPFAQSKRKRSQEIAMETVARLGGAAFFGDGGTTGGTSGPSFPSEVIARLDPEDARRLLMDVSTYLVSASQQIADGTVRSAARDAAGRRSTTSGVRR